MASAQTEKRNIWHRSAWDLYRDPESGHDIYNSKDSVANRSSSGGSSQSAVYLNHGDCKFPTGIYWGKTVAEITQLDPGYIIWCAKNVRHWHFAPETVRAASAANVGKVSEKQRREKASKK